MSYPANRVFSNFPAISTPLPIVATNTHSSIQKKKNLFGDQSSSSRIERLRNDALNKVKTTYPGGWNQKNSTEKNTVIDAISRVRGGGYVVPPKVTHRPIHNCPVL